MLESADNLVLEAVRHAVGTHAEPRLQRWYVRDETYLVASVQITRPTLKLVVKLEIPAKRPNRDLEVMARLTRLVRAQTSVPTGEVIGVDTTRSQWPWNILIVTELAGETWSTLYPRLDATARAVAQRQIGRAAAELEMQDAQPVLTGVLDSESAWAGVAESDLARLEFWRMTAGSTLRSGYAEVTPLPAAYVHRRPILQLLWCLEFADEHPTAEHQADTDRVCAELGIPRIGLR